MMITRKEKLESIKVLFLISLIFAVLFFDDIMLKPSDAEVISTTFYNVTFAPYIIGAMVALIIMIATNLKYAYGFEKRLLRYHLFGLMILCLGGIDRKSTRLNSSHVRMSYAVFCLKKKTSRWTGVSAIGPLSC